MSDWTERQVVPPGTAKAEFIALAASAWKRKWWLIGCVFTFSLAFGLYAKSLPNIYRASVVLVPATPSSGLGGLGSSLGALGGIASFAGIDLDTGASKTDEVLAVLASRQFIEAFIRKNQLLPVLYADNWDKQAGEWKTDSEPPTLAQAYKFFTGNILTVERQKGGSLIKLHVDWTDGELAAEWANELVGLLNAEMRTRAMEEADRSVRFLEEEAKRTSIVPAQQAIGRLMESQINQRMLANVTAEYALRVVDMAMAPDRKDPFKPRKILILGVGVAIGLTIGFFIVWFFAEPQVVASRVRESDPDVGR